MLVVKVDKSRARSQRESISILRHMNIVNINDSFRYRYLEQGIRISSRSFFGLKRVIYSFFTSISHKNGVTPSNKVVRDR